MKYCDMGKRCVINYASGRYVPSQQRLENDCNKYGVDLIKWTDQVPYGAKPHRMVPYQFKPYAFQNAMILGYTTVLWMDSVILINKSFNHLMDIIETDGYLILRNGWDSGQWCCDSALKPLGLTRESSFTYPQSMACVMGFDLSRFDILHVFNQWLNTSNQTFPGPWTNKDGEASKDPRVLGHRHDQTAISVFAHRAGWKFTDAEDGKILKYGYDPDYTLNSFPV